MKYNPTSDNYPKTQYQYLVIRQKKKKNQHYLNYYSFTYFVRKITSKRQLLSNHIKKKK